MNRTTLIAIIAVVCAGCGSGGDSGGAAAIADAGGQPDRGGTITVGDQSWTLVPSRQCSIYPNNQVNISGHAAEDESLTITIDYYPDGDGPTGITLGADSREALWYTVRDTIDWQIDGRRLHGTAAFSETRGGSGKTAGGSFEINC